MQVVVHMLRLLRWLLRLGLKFLLLTRTREPRSIGFRLGLSRLVIVIETAVLRFLDIIMLRRKDFGVLQRLDRGVVVVLMPFLLDEFLLAGLVCLLDMLVLDCWCDFFVDGSVYIATGGKKDLFHQFSIERKCDSNDKVIIDVFLMSRKNAIPA